MQLKARMLSSTVIPVAVALGVAGAVAGGSIMISAAQANPCAAKRAVNPCAAKSLCAAKCAVKRAVNPCAAKKACNPCAAKNPCNPCAAKKACNPCAAQNPCNPCGACNPCGGAAAAYSARCVIPRLQKAALCNPCAAKKACSPCAAKACNPCAAKKACNPCAAKRNPCAAKACNPCAAKKACNPCAAKNPCNPCAAKNPCNPCGAANPCNPCGGAAAAELSSAEAKAAYDCIITEMKAAYAKSGIGVAAGYTSYKRYSKVAYQSATHGGRYVQNYANGTAKAYGKFEKSGRMPVGSYLVKDSFTATPDGKVGVGPLFIMRKMSAGWNKESDDWKYAMVMPNGAFFGETKGRNAKNMKFCIECHITVAEEQDSMLFLPEEYR